MTTTPSPSNHIAEPRIVVGVDGSEASKEALRWSVAQARLTGAGLTAVMTWHLPTLAYGAAAPLPADLDLEGDSRTALTRVIHEIVGDGAGVEITAEVVQGRPAEELLRAAEGAALLVVGSRGHGAFTGMLLGSVSEHCVAHATCPVVVVRPVHAAA